MERTRESEVYGRGSKDSTAITLNVQTMTGSNFSICVNGKYTVEHLKKLVSKKIKVSRDRICLLHRERQLRDGTLEENELIDGSKIILIPNVETGLLSQRSENSVMQALESLNETQVNDFLSGKSPLNLTMRLGDNMMLIQLQLSTLNKEKRGLNSTPKTAPAPSFNENSFNSQRTSKINNCSERNTRDKHVQCERDWEMVQDTLDKHQTVEEACTNKNNSKEEDTNMSNRKYYDMPDISFACEPSPIKSLSNLVSSPIIKSTSDNEQIFNANIVNSSSDKIDDRVFPNIPSTSGIQTNSSSHTVESSVSDDSDNYPDQSSFLSESTIDEYPMEHLFNKGLFNQDDSVTDREISNLATTSQGAHSSNTGPLPSFSSINEPLKQKRYLLPKTSKMKNTIRESKQKAFMQSLMSKHKKKMQIREDNRGATASRTEPYIANARKLILQPSSQETEYTNLPSTSKTVTKMDLSSMAPSTSRGASCVTNANKLILKQNEQTILMTPSTSKQIGGIDNSKEIQVDHSPLVGTSALMEASKNLTQKLKKLSKEVLTNKVTLTTSSDGIRAKLGSGAVIESMKNHGKGIYSGTFSGTLNPALQDRFGRPKRDISTIIHILNDLLCASPPYGCVQKGQKNSNATSPGGSDKSRGCGRTCGGHGRCDGSHTSAGKSCSCEAVNCNCALFNLNVCPKCTENIISGELCKKCDTNKAFALENSKTKCKLDQLRLSMQQKKERREARRMKTMPYSSSTESLRASDQPSARNEEIDTAA